MILAQHPTFMLVDDAHCEPASYFMKTIQNFEVSLWLRLQCN